MPVSTCEIRGEIGRAGSEAPCPLSASWAVSVEGLSPVNCCNGHSRAMRNRWAPYYEVQSTKLHIEAAA